MEINLKNSNIQFKYLKDRLFWVCVGLYFLNRFVVKPIMVGKTNFFSSYFNDLLCIPFWLPIVLLVTKYAGFRSHNEPPDLLELGFYVFLWSIVFEYVAPAYGKYFNYPVADPWDIVCYATGAMIAWFFWNFNITDKTQIINQQS